jgi:hypothetical protein
MPFVDSYVFLVVSNAFPFKNILINMRREFQDSAGTRSILGGFRDPLVTLALLFPLPLSLSVLIWFFL